MSTSGPSTLGTLGPAPNGGFAPLPPGPPPAPPQADMSASPEVRAWLSRLKAEDQSIGRRNRWLALALLGGVLLLALVLAGIYRATVGVYAVIDGVEAEQDATNPGRLQIKYRVVSPGRVYCRRTSGGVTTEVIELFASPCEVDRPWSWAYQPGEPIELTFWSRRGMVLHRFRQTFPTPRLADIVVLIDTTGSMEPSIEALQRSCRAFSEQLTRQAIEHRLALIGFGDTGEGEWLEKHPFTNDMRQFQQWTRELKRFDGGDLPESALDALEEALKEPFDPRSVRYFYLVTDADFHRPTRSGLSVEQMAAKLRESHVILRVFSRPELAEAYAPLLGEEGRFDELEDFGKALSAGRILED